MDETLFLISSRNPWYGDTLIYLQTQTFRPNTSCSEHRRIRYQAKDYMIDDDTLYHRGVNIVMRRCLTHEEAEKVLNDYHLGACGGHLSGYATAQKILQSGYFWPIIFRDCIIAVRSCHACQICDRKTRLPPAPLHPVVAIGPFAKWAIGFMTCNPTSAEGHVYIIVTVDYFTKWVEVMPTLNNGDETATLFFFNHLVYGLEAVLPIQCKILSLKLTIDLLPETSEEEARFLELIHLDETHHDAALANEAHNKCVKAQFDKNVKSRAFSEGDLVLLYDQDSDKLGVGKFEPLRMGPYVVKWVLTKGAYELVDYDKIPLSQT
eukprot:PITA_28033